MSTLLIASRKGLFIADRAAFARQVGEWQVSSHHFHGNSVTQVLADSRGGAWCAALRLGHFGVKMQKCMDRGATWTELPAPAFLAKPTDGPWADDAMPWMVDLVWSLAAGGPHEKGTLWAGCAPAELFGSQDGGASWQLMDALWLDERRKGWFGGGNGHPGLHAVCVDSRDSNRVTIAISCGGVWRTLDAVAHWRLLGKGFHAPYMPPERDGDASVQDVHAMAACTAQPDVMWAQHHAGTYRSVDGGAHWSRTAAAMPTVFGLPIVADPVNPLRGWTVPAQADTHR